jgi:hypothetical protein
MDIYIYLFMACTYDFSLAIGTGEKRNYFSMLKRCGRREISVWVVVSKELLKMKNINYGTLHAYSHPHGFSSTGNGREQWACESLKNNHGNLNLLDIIYFENQTFRLSAINISHALLVSSISMLPMCTA